jgi:hypothetical protein
MYLLLSECTKIIRSEVLHVQCTTHSAVMPLGGLNLSVSVIARECFRLSDFWATVH